MAMGLLLCVLIMPMSRAFLLVPRSATQTVSFSREMHILSAESGPPQYKKRPASVGANVEVGRASNLITVNAEDGDPVDYQPGHVLALEIQDPDKGQEGEWMRGPYTVTRANATSFDVLYRVVGKKTHAFHAAGTGSKVQFGGKFKVPVLEGINPEGLERVVGVSTGVGIGPLIGFAEQALSQKTELPYRIDLYVAFRDPEDICCVDALDALLAAHPEKFSWTPVISSAQGHVSSSENLRTIAGKGPLKAGATHYHLVGNGAMVNEFKEGLVEAGVSDDRVTSEVYFNHKELARPEIVEAIGSTFKEMVVAT